MTIRKNIAKALIIMMCSASTLFSSALLDIEGDGKTKKVILPFNYYQRQENDSLDLIHQGGYKVYNIGENLNKVVIVGSLRPCIGLFFTEGKNAVVFHKHSTNSLDHLYKILEKNLDLTIKENIVAQIFTTKDNVEWKESNRQVMHGGNTHTEEVKKIKDYLVEKLGVARPQITANIFDLRNAKGVLRYPESSLGKYELAEMCVAVRLNDLTKMDKDNTKKIKLSSIDPFTEDVFNYKSTKITMAEYLGPNLEVVQKMKPGVDYTQQFISYDDIPSLYNQQSGTKVGYKIQRGICERYLNKEENDHYFNFFKKPSAEVFVKDTYGKLEFFPL